MDAKTFYENLRPEDERIVREIVQVLKKYHPIEVFAIDKAAKPHHHREYQNISLLLKGVNMTSYNLSIDEIEGMDNKIDVTRINTNNTIDDRCKYDSYVTDNRMIKINHNRTKIRLFYTINSTGVSPKISL